MKKPMTLLIPVADTQLQEREKNRKWRAMFKYVGDLLRSDRR